ncbi:MAG: hypothetical protein KDI67_05345 [Gammaproteobacteria bacterium]|nr:hypothetical protein [Gammaproteobacteria bacterium]
MNERDIFVTLVGLVGAAAILTTFVANLAGRMAPQSKAYLLLNLFGGILVALNSIWFDAYPAFVINVVWASASIWGLHRILRRNRNRNSSETVP